MKYVICFDNCIRGGLESIFSSGHMSKKRLHQFATVFCTIAYKPCVLHCTMQCLVFPNTGVFICTAENGRDLLTGIKPRLDAFLEDIL